MSEKEKVKFSVTKRSLVSGAVLAALFLGATGVTSSLAEQKFLEGMDAISKSYEEQDIRLKNVEFDNGFFTGHAVSKWNIKGEEVVLSHDLSYIPFAAQIDTIIANSEFKDQLREAMNIGVSKEPLKIITNALPFMTPQSAFEVADFEDKNTAHRLVIKGLHGIIEHEKNGLDVRANFEKIESGAPRSRVVMDGGFIHAEGINDYVATEPGLYFNYETNIKHLHIPVGKSERALFKGFSIISDGKAQSDNKTYKATFKIAYDGLSVGNLKNYESKDAPVVSTKGVFDAELTSSLEFINLLTSLAQNEKADSALDFFKGNPIVKLNQGLVEYVMDGKPGIFKAKGTMTLNPDPVLVKQADDVLKEGSIDPVILLGIVAGRSFEIDGTLDVNKHFVTNKFPVEEMGIELKPSKTSNNNIILDIQYSENAITINGKRVL
jgi:hypothetical protein